MSGICENIANLDSRESRKQNSECKDMDLNITEIFISNKRNLESQVSELESKLTQFQSAYSMEINDHNATKQQLNYIQIELNNMNDKYLSTQEELCQLDNKIKKLSELKMSISEENKNLTEQLEFTKSILTAKESENSSLRIHLQQVQNELDVTKLQLQQLNTGLSTSSTNTVRNFDSEKQEILSQKVTNLEQQLNIAQKERDQINIHYETYVCELNNQLKSVMLKNNELTQKVQNLSTREASLIEQISDMEIRLQNLQVRKEEAVETLSSEHKNTITIDVKALQDNYTKAQVSKALQYSFFNLSHTATHCFFFIWSTIVYFS